MPPRAPLTLAKSGPIDHVGAAEDHMAQAMEHIRFVEAELLAGIKHNAAEARRFAGLPLVKRGVADELLRLAESMEAAAQRIAAISAKGGS